jgi:glycosyltransferase involved in cell wall biosynthesis
MDCYDIVVAYADMPYIPYLAGLKNYIAFEHGSIRSMPYENNDHGCLMLLSYANAAAMYVTNIDCVASAEYITSTTNTPIVFGLHGIDITRIMQRIEKAAQQETEKYRFGVPKEEVLFFCPSRHDIDKQAGVFIKGDDKLIRAAGRIAAEFDNFKLVLVNFGKGSQQIKDMIEQLKPLRDKVLWSEPLGKENLYRAFLHADAVLDQFFLEAFGAITIEVLCAGGGILISQKIQEDQMIRFYGEQLPTLKCTDENDIYCAMKKVLLNQAQCRIQTEKGKEWIRAYHSNERIVSLMCKAFSCTSTG